MKRKIDIDQMVERLLSGDRRAAARLITMVEDEAKGHREVMKRIYPHTGECAILGITGSGGAGKSTLTDHLIREFRKQGKMVGVAVVDPSSPFSGGALLGDRIRLQSHFLDDGVFIRSLASRGYLGGLSKAVYDVIRIMEAMGADIVIVETLGTGQDEIDVIHVCHTCLLVLTPGMGDDIQAMKAGIMEIADIIVLNKADLDGAERSLRHLRGALAMACTEEGTWVPKVIPTVSVANKPGKIQGLSELASAIAEHEQYLKDSGAIDKVNFERVEQELGLIFKDELQKLIFKGLKGTGKKRKYIKSIIDRKNDPYSVVEEVLNVYLNPGK
ncbi:MAG: methylmalonyl Co-A mutase-associated GTPase MeaB [Thermoplasmata archaeon]|nr:MAG: methylmalonyl Co-A mutase-associated GTPase MeaB [Thermoplasmata archaeon]